jgi:hypothetical protein
MNDATTTNMRTELDFDTVEALGLDGTGRSVTDDAWPYSLENLDDEHFLLLLFLSNQAESYPDEAEAPETGLWYTLANAELTRRYGVEGSENLSAWVTGIHASAEDCIDWVRADPRDVLAVIAGDRA